MGVGVLGLVLRDVIVEPAWIAHLTTYLYEHMWRDGAPATDRMVALAVPFGLEVVMITGAASGFGELLALELATMGSRLVLGDRNGLAGGISAF